MKRTLIYLFFLFSVSSDCIAAIHNSESRIFIYSPAPTEGLHIADQQADGTWQHITRLCSSDYGPWGSGKRMLHPSITQAKDGTWRLVFQLDNQSPCFGAAYSSDLITWRPQDYPVVSTRGVEKPVVFENPDGSFDIYYQSSKGKRWVSATPNFRHFSPDRDSQISDDAWLRDTATVDGKLMEGNLFTVSSDCIAAIRHHAQQSGEDLRKSNERMHDDAKNLAHLTAPITATLTVNANAQKAISDKLIGIFFEDISYAADGGLYAEMVQNRDFEYNAKDHNSWNATTAWHASQPIEIGTEHPLHPNNPHYALLRQDTLWNDGWDGMVVEKGKKYDFSMYVFAGGQKQTFKIVLTGQDGTVLAEGKLKTSGSDWQQFTTVLTAKASDTKARLAIIPQKAAHVGVDMISLFPQETFMNRKNGLRKDLAETIARLNPKFVRFPGGCMSHGQGLDNIYHWNHTVGPLQERKPDFNIWHYHQTRGLGFYEYFQFCEDIGAEPLPVLAAGVPCQNSGFHQETGLAGQQGGIPMEDMPVYIQELLDLIEWANGDPSTSKWAKMRADAGHPEPFHLKYIGIGNEDIISTVFEERYEMICRAIRAKYPDIRICGTVGPFHTPSADYLEGWDFAKKHPDLQFMTDEHYYESTGWFLNHRDYYDRYDRNGTKVYLGEWAASTKTKRPNMETARAEALYLTDIERNGDVVHMTSYAPMLCKEGHSNWNPDMIYFTNTEVRTTPAYDVQRLFGNYCGDRYVGSQLSVRDTQLAHRLGASIVKDSKTGKTVVKMVNALPVTVKLSLQGMALQHAKGERMAGEPENHHPQCQPIELDGKEIELPPYSLTVVEQ